MALCLLCLWQRICYFTLGTMKNTVIFNCECRIFWLNRINILGKIISSFSYIALIFHCFLILTFITSYTRLEAWLCHLLNLWLWLFNIPDHGYHLYNGDEIKVSLGKLNDVMYVDGSAQCQASHTHSMTIFIV